MGVADKAKVTGRGGETSPASMAALTHTLEELERRLARLSDGRGGKSEAAQPDMSAKPAPPPQTSSERLRRIVDRSTQQAASMRAKSDMEGFSHDIVGTVVKELSQFRHDLRQDMAAGQRAGQMAMGHAFATLEATLATRDNSELIADGLADILSRLAILESREGDAEALEALREDTRRLKAVTAGLATQDDLTRHMGAVTDRLDRLAQSSATLVASEQFDDGVARLVERLDRVEQIVSGLPSALGLDRLEARLAGLGAGNAAAPDLAGIEERLDEISGAILALDRSAAPAVPAWLEERLAGILLALDGLSDAQERRAEDLAGRIDRSAFPEAVLEERLDRFMQRLEQAEDERYRRHVTAFAQELDRLETLWQSGDGRLAETEERLGAILKSVVERLSQLEAEARIHASDGFGGVVFDADFGAWQPEAGAGDAPEGLRAALDRHLNGRHPPEAEESAPAQAHAEPAPQTRYGRDVPDFGSILDRVRRHERAAGLEPSTRADFIAAARRAAVAAAEEADALQRGAGRAQGGDVSARTRFRKPMFMAAGAIMMALMALPFTQLELEPGGDTQTGEIASNGAGTTGPRLAANGDPDVSMEMTASVAARMAGALPEATGDIIAVALDRLPAQAVGPLPDLPPRIGDLGPRAMAGDAAAMAAIGVTLIDAAEVETGLAWLGQAARRGYAPAQYRLGSLYERGAVVAKDMATARAWYLVAARGGNVRAMHNLAVIDISGLAGAADREGAAHWFAAAAERGMADSQFNLAILHARGAGVPRDPAAAYKWFSIAARSGDASALRNRDSVATELNEAARAAIDADVAAWRPVPPTRAANEERYTGGRV